MEHIFEDRKPDPYRNSNIVFVPKDADFLFKALKKLIEVRIEKKDNNAK